MYLLEPQKRRTPAPIRPILVFLGRSRPWRPCQSSSTRCSWLDGRATGSVECRRIGASGSDGEIPENLFLEIAIKILDVNHIPQANDACFLCVVRLVSSVFSSLGGAAANEVGGKMYREVGVRSRQLLHYQIPLIARDAHLLLGTQRALSRRLLHARQRGVDGCRSGCSSRGDSSRSLGASHCAWQQRREGGREGRVWIGVCTARSGGRVDAQLSSSEREAVHVLDGLLG